ncbi:ABC-three component system protein [Bacillus toyonensis]|uniref:ABC-three component system protein n=1 Tax=Bacillus toyonensis TaxID=155322 RepID=UPI000BFD14C4|nr:ABC-three component system protein [Bacillus toyonensis]MED3541311.1 serine protease [Bacillus toyonensis]PHF83223.1 hypothetical protein COI46_25705 [Bacillus toyonensis]
MEIYSKYMNLAVKIYCINVGGSGCLFQPHTKDYSYVLTAKHCLEGTEDTPQSFTTNDIKVYINSNEEPAQLAVLDFYLHPQRDLAVIKVEYLEGIPGTLVSLPKDNTVVGIYGFPNILEEEETEWMGQRLKCSFNFYYPNSNIIEFMPETDVMTQFSGANENIVGLSGSGVYLEKNNNLFLIGIFTELKEENGVFKSLLGLDVLLINQLLKEKHLPLLIPEELLDLKKYVENAFSANEGMIKPVLKKNARSLMDLTPQQIIDNYNEKLYLPYNHFIEEDLLNPRLWEGWVALLTYLYMETEKVPTKDNFILSRKREQIEHRIKMFFTGYNNLSECIMELFVKNYDDLEQNDIIVINNNGTTPGTKSCNREKTRRVLRKIDSGERYKLIEEGIDISNPEYSKGIEFIHIDIFSSEFSEYDELEDMPELELNLKNCIKEVFNNVP